MTPERLAEIEARGEAATPGPWRAFTTGPAGGDHWRVYEEQDGQSLALIHANDGEDEDTRQPDAEFIAHARDDVPALVAEVRRLRAAVDAANKRLIDAVGFDMADLMHSLDECMARAERAEAAGNAALALHVRHGDVCVYDNSECSETDYCNHCKQLYPCATARALAPVADPGPHTTSDKETTT